MRNALIISLVFHIALGVITMRVIRFRHVRFVPREVYAVRLVSLEETTKPKPKETPPPPEDKPEEVQPQIEEEKPEELVPPTKPKKPKKEEPRKKTVPSTQIEKREDFEKTEADTTAVPSVTTGDMALDTDEFPFAYYLATIKRKIAANWSVPGTAPGGLIFCRVYFRISRSGSVESPGIETSSGNFLFDQSALRAVIQAGPLPPLPGGFSDDYLGVHFSFAYEEE